MSHIDSEVLKTVGDDLNYLRKEWRDDPGETSIRHGSAILRRLLVENVLQTAWRHVGGVGQPVVRAPDLDRMVATSDGTVIFASAGGAIIRGIAVAGFQIDEFDADYVPPDNAPEIEVERDFKLTAFLESACLVDRKERINRRELIKYFANVRGGVHVALSARARHSEELLIQRMKRFDGRVPAPAKNALFFELLAIGQSVARSSDIASLISKLSTC